jgi:hypothetical protein
VCVVAAGLLAGDPPAFGFRPRGSTERLEEFAALWVLDEAKHPPTGELFDAKEAADGLLGLLELARTGGEKLRQDLAASGDLDVATADPNEPTWEQIPKADRTEI